MNIETFATIVLLIQLLHSIEELSTGFHKKWFVMKLTFKQFLSFEIVFNLFWIAVVLLETFPFRYNLLSFFVILMFFQSSLHIAWYGQIKKYVPGLTTALVHIGAFLVYYFQVLLK